MYVSIIKECEVKGTRMYVCMYVAIATVLVSSHDSDQCCIFVLHSIPQAKSAIAGSSEDAGVPREVLEIVHV
jgi:hypothetical protein